MVDVLAGAAETWGSSGVGLLAVEDMLAAEAPAVQPATPDDIDIAFLQYTSGSTGHPKGVMVTHRSLAENHRAMTSAFAARSDDVVFSWLPLYHDMGLIGTALLPLALGLRTVLLNTLTFVHDPLTWPLGMAKFGATCSGGPNFAYQRLVDRYDAARLTDVDLTTWRLAFNGAEPIDHRTMDAFAARYCPHGFDPRAFYPCYGLAEATLFVSGSQAGSGYGSGVFSRRAAGQRRLTTAADDADAITIVSSGTPAQGTSVVIRGDRGQRLAPGSIGEICVRSASVASGYWEDPVATADAFRARIVRQQGTFLRTGDLGALFGEELYIVGRAKDVIIVAGRNFYAHDIEAAGSSAGDSLRRGSAAAFQLDEDGQPVVLAVEARSESSARLQADPAAVNALGWSVRREVVAACDLELAQVVLVAPGAIAKTSSGKIRRAETRARYLAGELPILGRWSARTALATAQAPEGADQSLSRADLESRPSLIRAMVGHAIAHHVGVVPCRADSARPLASLGFDSLSLVVLKGTIEQHLGQSLDASLFFGDRSLDDLVHAVAGLPPAEREVDPTPSDAITGTFPAAEGQMQLLFYDQLFPEDTANCLPCAVRIAPRFDPEALRSALTAVVARHPALRTTLGPPGTRTQIVHSKPSMDWHVRELECDDPAYVRHFFDTVAQRPFELTRGPLIRAAAVAAPDSTSLLFACHHAVADYWSLRIILAELMTTVQNDATSGSAEAPEATAVDWAKAQPSAAAETGLTGLAHKWRPLRNHVLFARDTPAYPCHNPAATVDFEIDARSTLDLYRHSRTEGFTPFVTICAAYMRALHGVTGRPQVVVGTPHHGRTDRRFARTVGYFVNLVPLLGDFRSGDGIAGLEERTWQELRTALRTAEVPFSRLVSALAPKRHGQNPLFQATLIFQQSADGILDDGFAIPWTQCRQTFRGLEVETVDVPPRDAAFALSLYGARSGACLAFRLVYQQDLIDARVARRVCEEFNTHLAALVRSANLPEDTS